MDTWHHLRALPEAYSPRNLERKKIRFRTSPNKFAQLCEVENASTLILSSWSISHDCAKISHGHAKSLFHNSLMCCSQHPFCFISHDYAKISHGHAKSRNMLFRLLLAIFPISSFLIHLHHLQLSSKSQSKPIALLLSLCIWIIINFICFLQFDSFPFVTNLSKTYLEMTPKLHKTC